MTQPPLWGLMEDALTAEGQQETREARGGGGRHCFCSLPQVVESFQPRTPWPSSRNFSGTKLSPRGPVLGLRMEGGGGGVPVWRPHFRSGCSPLFQGLCFGSRYP